MTLGAARDSVARGAALLDEVMPGWWARIDLKQFDIAESDVCALGQLFDEPVTMKRWQRDGYSNPEEAAEAYRESSRYIDYPVGLRLANEDVCVANYELGLVKLGLKEAESGDFGFNETVNHETGEYIEYGELDEAWREVIYARQKSPVLA